MKYSIKNISLLFKKYLIGGVYMREVFIILIWIIIILRISLYFPFKMIIQGKAQEDD